MLTKRRQAANLVELRVELDRFPAHSNNSDRISSYRSLPTTDSRARGTPIEAFFSGVLRCQGPQF